MNYLKKTFNMAWFGIKNNRVLTGIMLLLCVVILPGFTIIEGNGWNAENTVMAYGLLVAYSAGLIIPMVLYSYVQSRRECDFYNSMPVKRSQYFWGYFMSGFALFLVPFTLLTVLHVFAGGIGNPFKYYLPIIGVFIIVFCTVITAVTFSGSVLSTLVTLALRNAAPAALVILPVVLSGANLGCYLSFLADKLYILTPAAAFASLEMEDYSIMFWQLIIAAAELIIGFLLHRCRRSETTTALAFPKTRYLFQYSVMLIFVFLVDALLLGIFGDEYYYGDRHYNNILDALTGEELALSILFTVVAVFLVFIIMNMILDKSGSAAFKKFQHFFIFLAGYAGLLVLLFSTILNALPPFILPFEPDSAIIRLTEYRQATAEEKALINRNEWNWREDGEYIYGAGENEIYISKSESYYGVTDKKKLAILKEAAQWGGEADGLELDDYHRYSPEFFNGAETVGSVYVYFLKGLNSFSVSEKNDDIDVWRDYLYLAKKWGIRTGYTTDIDETLKLSDCSLKAED